MTSDPRAVRADERRDGAVFPPLALAVSAIDVALRVSRAGCAAVRAGIVRFRDEVDEQVRADRARSDARRATSRARGRTTNADGVTPTPAGAPGGDAADASETTSSRQRASGPRASGHPRSGQSVVEQDGSTLALPDYDHLPASQIVAMLADLDGPELDAIEAYELGHRHRRTVLGKIDQLRA